MAVLRDIIASSIASAAATQGGERRRCSRNSLTKFAMKTMQEGARRRGVKKSCKIAIKNIYQHCYEVNLVSERLSNDSSDFATIGIY